MASHFGRGGEDGAPVDVYELTIFDGWIEIGEEGELLDWGERSASPEDRIEGSGK